MIKPEGGLGIPNLCKDNFRLCKDSFRKQRDQCYPQKVWWLVSSSTAKEHKTPSLPSSALRPDRELDSTGPVQSGFTPEQKGGA